MNPVEFGKFIASLRNEKKLTQEQLAEKLFIDKRKISRWECGMSIPDFDMLIKLSEILDVSLYELSICKRLEKEKLTRKAINKFKGIKDLRKYKFKQIIKIIIVIVIGIVFLFSFVYTLKFYGTVSIYIIESLDEKYLVKGTLMQTDDYTIYNINKIYFNDEDIFTTNNLDKCDIGIFNGKFRLFNFTEKNMSTYNIQKHNFLEKETSYNTNNIDIKNTELLLNIICNSTENKKNTHLIKLHFAKIYDNKLF